MKIYIHPDLREEAPDWAEPTDLCRAEVAYLQNTARDSDLYGMVRAQGIPVAWDRWVLDVIRQVREGEPTLTPCQVAQRECREAVG